MPEGQQDDRLQHRYKQLLESPPAIVNAMDTSPNEEDSPTEQDNDDDSPELDAPFVDPDLQALWTTAVEQDKSFKRIRRAVIKRARKFPKELELQVSISECDIDNLGRLRFHERI